MGDIQRFESSPMLRIIAEDGTLIDPAKLPEFEGVHILTDARRTAGMKFLTDAGLSLDDRMLSADVQAILDGAMFPDAGDKAA